MCDGSTRAATTNDFTRGASDYLSASAEWAVEHPIYWFPNPTSK
jgi:hypothetical protein